MTNSGNDDYDDVDNVTGRCRFALVHTGWRIVERDVLFSFCTLQSHL